MVIEDEDGPIEKIPLERFPRPRGNQRVFETIAAPVSRELDRHADEIGAGAGEMHPLVLRNINVDFARTIPGAVGEISGQLGSQSEIDPAPMFVAALESLGDLDGSGHGLPPEGTTSGGVTGGGGSEFGTVQWAESGAGAAPPPRPPSSQPPPGQPPPGSDDPNQPPPGEPPPSEPAPLEPPPSEPPREAPAPEPHHPREPIPVDAPAGPGPEPGPDEPLQF